jgi:SpoIID/LytB domain protein
MKRTFFLFFSIFLLISLTFFNQPQFSYSDELDEINKQINDLTKALDQSIKATQPLESQLNELENQLKQIKSRLLAIENDINFKKIKIDEGYKDLEKQEKILNKAINDYYIKSYYYSPILIFLSSKNASNLTQVLAYQKAATNQDKLIITNIALTIHELETKKTKLEEEQEKLTLAKADLDKQSEKLDKIVSGAKEYQAKLSTQIAQLTAKQQQLLAQKLGSLNLPTSLGAGPLYCTDDRNINPGFGQAFAFFTFGIPHRVGMNQYGAYGRAKQGQNHEEILRAYFDNINFETRDNIKIKVQGYGEMDLEDYLLGIYEMPNDWPIEALKAQAVAARSYALSYTDNGKNEICTTQACQVYKGGNKGGNWEQAVKETKGKVMVSGGQVITAWYSSTDGGYTFYNSDVWGGTQKSWTKRLRDTSGEVSSFDDLLNKSFDKDSPCMYAAQGYRKEYANSAWLKSEEVADIVNVLMLAKADSSTQVHLSQIDKPNPDGKETWDATRVKQELKNRNFVPFNNINSVSVDWDKSLGKTTTITFVGDTGSKSFDGGEFKTYFNLRAPANIQIVGPLYNVEKK